ncbi:Kinase-like domain-containing protein [Mycena sanguinolenta]|uniref:Kinase-like domain-containing protein n=1 Tax=Mycena sanguinolenta TaxID=230812 RepID=A0A8H7D4K8_9AGAR|nr:Kinase-like domain-containing protein [Mycena sanguinolenta]
MFDFPSYLASQLTLKPTDFEVETLAGGMTNETVRATFATAIRFPESSKPFSSVVLKYAPPYIAADPAQPMSIHRQFIEANALRYLAETPGIRDLLTKFPRLKIPSLIHHDSAANVLWITDLGVSQTIARFLTIPPSLSTSAPEIATMLGAFISQFWQKMARPAPKTIALFARQNEQDDPVHFLSSTALKVMSSHGVPDAEILGERIRTTMQTKHDREICLGMVDFWPGSILIFPDGSCGLVDWEYFGPSTPGAEIGMLVAHLHLLIAKSRNEPEVCNAVRTFIWTFLDSYGAHVPPTSAYFKRQALVAYGREMINAIEFFATDLDEGAQKRVLDAGVHSLHAAGASEIEVDVKLDGAGEILWDNVLQ